MSKDAQTAKIAAGQGFIAALDQSGGSTPKVLGQYGVGADAYSNEEEMFDQMHAFRSRIATTPAFDGNRVVGAILFEMTMDREIEGKPSATYLWEEKGVVPFLKIDQGLAEAADGIRLMNDMPDLDALLERAVAKGIFGTKERSVIDAATPEGVAKVVAQQFEVAAKVLSYGLMPIIEPEVTITIEDKAQAEDLLLAELVKHVDALPDGQQVMLKLSLPSKANQYKPLVDHPKVLKVVALSGGYSREVANEMLSQNTGMIASFSRALAEGLTAQQSDAEFDAHLDGTIQSIYEASIAG